MTSRTRYALPDQTTLWLLNDSFLSASPNGPIDATSVFVRNTAFLESQQSKLTLLESRHSYLDDGEQLLDRWWWFHGGHVEGRLLQVVTTEMLRTDALGWSINFEPVSTWITTIDWPTARIVRMQPAPNNGVTPVYGFSVASDHAWTYLYGNNHLYGRGDDREQSCTSPAWPTTRHTHVLGWRSLDSRAERCDQHHDPRDICLQAVRLRAWQQMARHRQGRRVLWRPDPPLRSAATDRALAYHPQLRSADQDRRLLETCTYDAMARTLTPGSLLLWWSNNAYDEQLVRAEPSIYRPSFTQLTLPAPVAKL